MKISWIPIYNKNGASSRIRVYSIHETLNDNFKEIQSNIGYKKDSDVLIVQKIVNKNIHNYFEDFRGIKIFDFLEDNSDRQLISLSEKISFFTTPTEYNKKRLNKLNIKTPCYIIKDCIDYNITETTEPLKKGNKTCWFGNNLCEKSVNWMIPFILKNNYTFNKIKWDLKNIVNNIKINNLCILSHKNSKGKSNNKMLVAIMCGLPCLINDSESYSELVNIFNLNFTEIKKEEDIYFCLDHFSNFENRKKYLKDIQPYVKYNFSAYNISNSLLKTINDF
jgi:hypothetical protein